MNEWSTTVNFDQAFDRLMGHEGVYTPGENDPGGETKWGISKRSYPNEDIKALTRDQAKAIYLRDFWRRGQMERFDSALSFQVFDFAVNSGIGTAIRALQRAAGVADDGWIGPITINAIRANSGDVAILYVAERLEFMTRLANWPQAGRGWARRIADNLRYVVKDA